jgi:epoxyqueuosine reductase
MNYMAKHGVKRSRPAELEPGTYSIITVRMNYLPGDARNSLEVLADDTHAYISRYALGRDYHKVLRNRLEKLAQRIQQEIGKFGYRVFTDSAPVMEVEIASHTGLGWRGKHSLLLSKKQGSWFFLGEIYTDLPLPADPATSDHCGDCTRCLNVCPTQAIVAPYRVDARRCISYLTIEHRGNIPVELRPLMGNRIYGCDDCQLHCPWNRFAQVSREADFKVRNGLDDCTLLDLFDWSEDEFRRNLVGSPIYRIGHEQWQRNLAVALGNASPTPAIRHALQTALPHATPLVQEHISWALQCQADEKTLE